LVTLLTLRCGAIDFEYAQADAVRVPLGVRIEPGAERHVLAHTPRDRCRQFVLGESAAHREKRAAVAGDGRGMVVRREAERRLRGRTIRSASGSSSTSGQSSS
jgi:hypothetical protein